LRVSLSDSLYGGHGGYGVLKNNDRLLGQFPTESPNIGRARAREAGVAKQDGGERRGSRVAPYNTCALYAMYCTAMYCAGPLVFFSGLMATKVLRIAHVRKDPFSLG